MIRSILIGIVAGQRAMTPLALVSGAARRGTLPAGAPGRVLFANPIVASGAVLLAAAEMAGDKMPTAPARVVLPGLVARSLTAGFVGAAFAPASQRKTAGLAASLAAIAAAHVGLALRTRAMAHFGQTSTGFVEDAVVLGAGAIVADLARPYPAPCSLPLDKA